MPDRNELLNILPATHYVRPDDALMDPAAVLRKVLPYDQRTFEAAARVLRSDPQLEAEIVHIGGFDNVCHAFWQYRFPGDYRKPPAAADVEALGPVIDRYLEFIDRDLSALISAVPETPNVVVISDHGEGATDMAAPWRGVHASPGIFLIAGPDVIKRSDTERVSYYDIVPTILDIEHLAKPDDMRGHSVLQLTDEGPQGQP